MWSSRANFKKSIIGIKFICGCVHNLYSGRSSQGSTPSRHSPSQHLPPLTLASHPLAWYTPFQSGLEHKGGQVDQTLLTFALAVAMANWQASKQRLQFHCCSTHVIPWTLHGTPLNWWYTYSAILLEGWHSCSSLQVPYFLIKGSSSVLCQARTSQFNIQSCLWFS